MGKFKPLDHIQNLGHGLGGRQRAILLDEFLQRFAGHQLHHDVGLARILIDCQDKDAARVCHHAGEPPFLAKALDRFVRGIGIIQTNHLDGDVPVRSQFHAFVNGAHAARAEFSNQAVSSQDVVNSIWADARTGRQTQGGGFLTR